MSQNPIKVYERKLQIGGGYINLPIKHGSDWQHALLLLDGKVELKFAVEIAGAEIDYWTHIDARAWTGQEVLFRVESGEDISLGIERITVSDEPEGNGKPYQEKHRLHFHYSPRVSGTNDPNGLVYANGLWHFFYQNG